MHASRLKVGKADKPPPKQQELTHTLVTIPPDGGWGWMVLAISTWDTLCIDGTSLAYSVIQKQVSGFLSITEVQSSLFVSVFNCLVYLMGPVVAALANRFGFRMLNVVGGALGGAALAGCAYSHTFILTMMLFGVVTGVGGSMIYMVSMAAPGYWFDKRRSLAFGVSNSATGIACLIIPALSQLITQKNWHMVFVFVCAMYLVAFAGGFLIRKPPMVLVEIEGYVPETDKQTSKQHAAVSMSILEVRGASSSNRAVEEKLKQMSMHTNVSQLKAAGLSSRRLSEPSIIFEQKSFWEKICPCCQKSQEIQIERPLYKSDIFLTSRIDVKTRKRTDAEQLLADHKMTTAKDIKQQLSDGCHCCPEAIKRPLKDMISLTLLKNVVYIMFVVATMTYYSAIYVTYLFVPRTSERKGLGEDTGIIILQLFGGFMALSRISLGVIFFYFPKLPPHYFTGIYVTLGGVCHFSLAFTKNKIVLYCLGAAMGFLTGVWVPMRSVLVVRYIGLERLTNAMGMLFVVQAIGALYGAPVAQALSTVFDEDYVTYYFAGAMYALTGVLALPLECLHNCMTRIKDKKTKQDEDA